MQRVILSVKADAEQVTSSEVGSGVNRARLPLLHEIAFPDGTGTGEAEAMWGDTLNITAAAVAALELDALDPISNIGPVAFTVVKGICVRNKSTSGKLTLGGGSGGSSAPNVDAWSGKDAGVIGSPFSDDDHLITLGPGDVFVWTSKAGVAVVNSTADVLGVEAVTSNQTAEILIWGDAT